MSPRGKPRGRWADRAYLEWELRTDTDIHNATEMPTGRVNFPDLPLDRIDRLDVTLTIGHDDRGRLAITSVEMSKPITMARLRALPLEAMRARCDQLWRGHSGDWGRMLYGNVGTALERAREALGIAGAGDRNTDEFLKAVATVSREARALGLSGWEAVRDSFSPPVSDSTAHRYVAKAKKRHGEIRSRAERAPFDTGTARLTGSSVTPLSDQPARKK